MISLLGPEDTRLRRMRSVLAFAVVVLVVVSVIAAAVGRAVPAVWALGLAGFVIGAHLWSWPRADGRPVATAEPTLDRRSSVAAGLSAGAASGFAVVLQGGTSGEGLAQSLVTGVVAVPLLLLLSRRRRT